MDDLVIDTEVGPDGAGGDPGQRVPAGATGVPAGTSGDDLAQLSDDELSAVLGTHAAHMAVAECRLCLLAAEVERRGFWAAQGARSCAHWLSWRCGTSPLAAREHLRVGKALGRLPLLREAFSSGTLSYSKARALTRIATVELEATLLEMAAYATASQLETIVRAYRRASADEGRLALERHANRSVHSSVDDEGMVVISARLAPEDGATVLAAIEMTRHALAPEKAPEAAGGVPAGTSPEASGWPGPPDPSAPAEPPEPPEPWAGSHAAGGADALVAICEAAISRGVLHPSAYGPHASVVVHVDDQVLCDAEAEGCAHIEGVGVVAAHTLQRLACDAASSTVVFGRDGKGVARAGRVVPEGSTRQVPLALRRAVLVRDGGCRFPGCSVRRYVDVHHVLWVSRGGRTTLTNLVSLCRFHHRCVHEGGYELSMDPTATVAVRAPDGRELAVPSVLPGASPGGLEAEHAAAGIHLDDTTMPTGGEPFSLDLTVDVLIAAAARPTGEGAG